MSDNGGDGDDSDDEESRDGSHHEGRDDEFDGDGADRDGDDRRSPTASSLSLDETLELLANYERRRVLGFLMNAPDGTAAVDELVDHFAARQAERAGERPGRGHVATPLHHVHLSKLADAGVVEYDARSQQIRYRTDGRLEAWHDCITARERE